MQADALTIHTETAALLSASIATAKTMSVGDSTRLIARQDEALEAQGWERHPWQAGTFTKGEATATRRGVLVFHN